MKYFSKKLNLQTNTTKLKHNIKDNFIFILLSLFYLINIYE